MKRSKDGGEMKGKKLLALLLALTLGVTQVGMPVYAATDLDDVPDLEFEEGVEDWSDCYLDGHTEVKDKAVAATCTTSGKTAGSHCSECGEILIAQKEIPMLGHQIVVVPGKAPTATEVGWTDYSYCDRCKEFFVEKIVLPVISTDEEESITPEEPTTPDQPATPEDSTDTETDSDTEISTPVHTHNLVKLEAKSPTCTKTGLTEGLYCSLCKEVIVKQQVVPKKAHVVVVDRAVDATLSKDGRTQGKHCKNCGKVTVAQKVIPRIKTVNLSYQKVAYTGKKIAAPKVTVKDRKGKVLTVGKDYTVTGLKARKNVGVYQVTITFKGSYTGTKKLTYSIVPKTAKNVKAELYGYDDIQVTWNKAIGATGYNVYYKVSGAKNYKFLIATTKLSAKKKNLTDGKKYVFKVVPYYKTAGKKYTAKTAFTSGVYTLKKLSTPKVTKSRTKVKVKWTNIHGETGYQISKSTKKSGTNIVATYKTTKGTYKTLKATKGKTYYYKVRAYKKVKINGKTKTIYGPWSKTINYKRK